MILRIDTSVHVAAALEANVERFVTAEQRQATIARRAGLATTQIA